MFKLRTNKYNNRKICGYDSKKEYEYSQLLKIKQKLGEIKSFKTQQKFTLIPVQKCKFNGKILERACTYTADFILENIDGSIEVIDVKGFKTKDYIIKRKLMLFIHGIKVIEI